MNRKDNPFTTIDELEERLHEAHTAGEKAQPIPDSAREYLVLAQEYLRGLKDHMANLHIGRDIEAVDIQDTHFETGRALIRETESLIDGAHAAIEHDKILLHSHPEVTERDHDPHLDNSGTQANPHHEQDTDFYRRLDLENPGPARENSGGTFVASIYSNLNPPQDQEAHTTGSYHTTLDHVVVDADQLVQLSQQDGISAPQHSDPDMSPDTAFRGLLLTEDRAIFEQNAHKYYDTHIHELNGNPPAPVDYQRATELIGSPVEHAPNRHEVALDSEEPELGL